MLKSFAWNQFVKTGNIETYIEYKRMEELEKKGEVINETCESERDCNKRSSI